MLDAFRSHCRQNYTGEFELLFGVASLSDPAAAAVKELQAEFPERTIRLVECPQQLGHERQSQHSCPARYARAP